MKINTSNQYDIPGSADPIATYEEHCIKDANCALTIHQKMGIFKYIPMGIIHPKIGIWRGGGGG